MNNSFMIQLGESLDKVDVYKPKIREKSIDYLQGRVDQYEKSFRSYFDSILGQSLEMIAIQSVLEEKERITKQPLNH